MELYWLNRVPSSSGPRSVIAGCPDDATGWGGRAKLRKEIKDGCFAAVFLQNLSDPRAWPRRHFPWRSEYHGALTLLP